MALSIFENKDIERIRTREHLQVHLDKFPEKKEKVLERIRYHAELATLQEELVKLQNWILQARKRLVIIFEGRDASGKGGTIRRFTRYLNPRSHRIVALSKPTTAEKGQWYFRRHVKELPNPGEIVFFDRSWYNRAVVEPVMGFCTKKEYNRFMNQVRDFEHMLYEDGVHIVKFWFSITKKQQQLRFAARRSDPLKQWKLSPVDEKSIQLWDAYSHYVQQMMIKSHTNYCPWTIVATDEKKYARLESIRHVISLFNYKGKDTSKELLFPDTRIVFDYNRSIVTKL